MFDDWLRKEFTAKVAFSLGSFPLERVYCAVSQVFEMDSRFHEAIYIQVARLLR
jgi:hypothetical protein